MSTPRSVRPRGSADRRVCVCFDGAVASERCEDERSRDNKLIRERRAAHQVELIVPRCERLGSRSVVGRCPQFPPSHFVYAGAVRKLALSAAVHGRYASDEGGEASTLANQAITPSANRTPHATPVCPPVVGVPQYMRTGVEHVPASLGTYPSCSLQPAGHGAGASAAEAHGCPPPVASAPVAAPLVEFASVLMAPLQASVASRSGAAWIMLVFTGPPRCAKAMRRER